MMKISARLTLGGLFFFLILGNGKLLVTPNKVYAGINKIDLTESVPSGIIAMWSGASNAIPTGWVLCDGQNGTPNLVDRFIVGAGSKHNPGDTGGSDTVTLTVKNMPPHNHGHNLSVASNGSHAHNFSGTTSVSYSITSTGSGLAVYSSNPGTKYDIVSVLNSSGGINHSQPILAQQQLLEIIHILYRVL